MIKINYSEINKDTLIKEQKDKGLLLIEDAMHENESFLIFEEQSKVFAEIGRGRRVKTKQLASQKINLILSDVQQRNSLYTLYQYGKRVKSSLTVEEKAEIADLEDKWTQIESIRTASNQIEAEINNLQTVEEVQAYNINNNSLWPI